MVRPRGTPSTGRHRIEITRRLDKNSRQVNFSKRRSGLFKKCSELRLLCGADVAVIVFSEAGNVYALGSPSVNAVLRRNAQLLAGAPATAADDAWVDDDDLDLEALEEMFRTKEAIVEQVVAEIERMNSIGDKVIKVQGERRSWWEADVEALEEEVLTEFFRALGRIRDNVRRYADELPSAPPSAAAPAPAPVAHDGDAASNYWAY